MAIEQLPDRPIPIDQGDPRWRIRATRPTSRLDSAALVRCHPTPNHRGQLHGRSPSPIPQINGAIDPTTATGGSFGVLLVDDSHHQRIPLVPALRKRGYRVLHAAGAESAEAISRTSKYPIHALLAREEMKRMNGADVARRLTLGRPDIRVLLTGLQRAGPKPNAVEPAASIERPGSALIEDPFRPVEPRNRVRGLLASSGSCNEEGCPCPPSKPWPVRNRTFIVSGANGLIKPSTHSPSVPDAASGSPRCACCR